MQYTYIEDKINYEKFAAGRVLYSTPGVAPFPVRLVDEIFQRACSLLGKTHDLKVFDPCLGSGYMMTVLGFLHYSQITSIDGSDLNSNMIEIANKNLGLLTKKGLKQRVDELQILVDKYGKESHIGALIDAKALLAIVDSNKNKINTSSIVCDIANIGNTFREKTFDITILDAPYGNLTSWEGNMSINSIFSLGGTLTNGGIMVIVTNKETKFKAAQGYTQKSYNHGKRRITFIKKDF